MNDKLKLGLVITLGVTAGAVITTKIVKAIKSRKNTKKNKSKKRK